MSNSRCRVAARIAQQQNLSIRAKGYNSVNVLRLFPFGFSEEKRREQKLIFAAQRGDRKAFDALAHACLPALRGFIVRRAGVRAADDILQDALLAAWVGRARYSSRAPFKAWLFAIAAHKCTDYFRCLERMGKEIPLEWAADQADTRQDEYTTVETTLLVRSALQQLPSEQREVLELYYDGGFSLPEIAHALERNLNTVKYQFYRAHTVVERVPDCRIVSEPVTQRTKGDTPTIMCCDREQEILLLAHGELAPFRAVRVRAHLRRCAACQQRYKRLASVSAALATALAAPSRRRWKPGSVKTSVVLISPKVILLFCLLLTLTAILSYKTVRRAVKRHFAPVQTGASASVEDDCDD